MIELVKSTKPEAASTEAVDLKAYELYRTPELDQAIKQVTDALPSEKQEMGRKRLLATLRYISAEALIQFIKLENPATEPAAHLVIENLELFAAGKPPRIEAMSKASLDYLRQTYPHLVKTEAANVINAAHLFTQPSSQADANKEIERAA